MRSLGSGVREFKKGMHEEEKPTSEANPPSEEKPGK
jgi:Sec-independent protein translocase protein TatA